MAAKVIIVRTEVALVALGAGNLDYTTLSTSAIEAALKGLPIRLVAVTNRQPVLGLVVPKGITQVSDLKGKRLAISSFGGVTYSAAVYLLKHYGMSAKDVIIRAVGGNVARIAALQNESVDAALISSPGDIIAAREGFRVLMDVGDIYKLPFGGVSTTLGKIQQNPDEVRKVVRAHLRAMRSITDPINKEDVVEHLARFFRLDKSSAAAFYHKLVPSLNPSGMVDKDKIKLVIDSAVERGLTDKALDPDMVVDFSLAKEVGL